MKFFKEIQKPVNEAILKDQRLGEGVNHPALQGWDLMSVREKRDALVAAGLAHSRGGTPMTSIALDDFLHAAKLKAQNQEDELGMGAGGRRELQRQADELAEMKRVTLRNERLHDEEVAFQRAETIQQRKDEMKKIADKYEHDLKVIDKEHSNNMQAIRTGNDHEIRKMNMEYQHEKEMWDKNNPKEDPPTPEYDYDEPEQTKPQQGNKFDQDTGEPIKPGNSQQSNQWHTSQQLTSPTKPTKPGNKDDEDITDVEPKPNKPLTLGNNMKKESFTAKPQIQKPLMAVSLDRWKEAVLKRYPEARFATQKMINGATFATDRTGQVGIYDPKNSYAKVGPEDQITKQGVGEASKPDAYQRDEINATSGFGKNSYAYQMDGGANDEDHESDRRREQQVQSGTWYVRINGKIVKDKAGNAYTFRGKAAANKAALTMQAKPFNKGKEIMLTTNPNDKVAEADTHQPSMHYSEELARKVFAQDPNLDASGKADAVLDAGWPFAVADLGKKSAQYKFAYDEDFPSDFVSAYAWLQQNQGVAESTLRENDSPVAGAITRRILLQRADLLQKYGPQKVMAAIDDVADFVGDTEEIGSSDVSGWIKQVEQTLAGMDEGIEEASLAQMRDYFNQPDDSMKVNRAPGTPGKPAAGIPHEIQALVNKMYHSGKVSPEEFKILQDFQRKTKINVGIKEATTGNTGYDSMLAVMKAVDAGQDATFNLGGEPITLDYNEARFLAGRYKAFLKAGRQEEFLKYMESPVAFDRLMKQLRDLMDKQKNFKGSVQGERGVEESSQRVDSLVTNGLKIMRGPTRDDAIAALKTQVGERDFNERRGFYNFYVRQLMDMYSQQGVEEAAPAMAKLAGGLGLGAVAAAGAPALVGILGPLVGIPFAAYAAYSAAKLGMKGVEKLWDMASAKLGGDDKVEQYTQSKIAGLPPEEAKAAAAVVSKISESRKSISALPQVNENEYWCQIDSVAKPIPEGYKRLANGYITRI
jgi:hypothetical protein